MFVSDVGQSKVIEKTLPRKRVLGIVPFGGAEGTRTPYLCDANAAFSLVNYGPVPDYYRRRVSDPVFPMRAEGSCSQATFITYNEL